MLFLIPLFQSSNYSPCLQEISVQRKQTNDGFAQLGQAHFCTFVSLFVTGCFTLTGMRFGNVAGAHKEKA